MKRGPKPKLSPEQRTEMIQRVRSGELSRKEAAFEYGLSTVHVCRMVNGWQPK